MIDDYRVLDGFLFVDSVLDVLPADLRFEGLTLDRAVVFVRVEISGTILKIPHSLMSIASLRG